MEKPIFKVSEYSDGKMSFARRTPEDDLHDEFVENIAYAIMNFWHNHKKNNIRIDFNYKGKNIDESNVNTTIYPQVGHFFIRPVQEVADVIKKRAEAIVSNVEMKVRLSEIDAYCVTNTIIG